MKLVVVGGGFAGVAAAWRGRQLGAEVSLFHARAGASELSSGALDLEPWPTAVRARPLAPELEGFLAAFELEAPASRWVVVATCAGTLRPARGRERALLDLAPFAGQTIAVLDLGRHDFDAEALAQAWSEAAWARSTATRFRAVPLELPGAPSQVSGYDFAQTLAATEQRRALSHAASARLREEAAVLMGPWSTLEPGGDVEWERWLGRPVGETCSPPGGVAGARFERQRARVLEAAGVSVSAREVEALTPEGEVVLVDGERVRADAVVLALGGVVAGGIVLGPPGPEHAGGAAFRLGVRAEAEFELDGVKLDGASTLHGIDFTARGLGALERVGVACQGAALSGHRRVFAAGELRAGEPRTALHAMLSGLRAAQAALDA